MLMAVVAVTRGGRLFGIDIPREGEDTEKTEPLVIGDDGTVTVNTTPLTKDITGFTGPTPVEITIKDDRIVKVKPLKNNETPEFYGAVVNSDMLDSWNGLTLQEAAGVRPDAVSGATITSTALIRNVEAGISYALDTPHEKDDEYAMRPDFRFFCVTAVILIASIVPLVLNRRSSRVRPQMRKAYRNFQLIVNVVILGFWGGTFISYSLMTGLMTNGIKTAVMIPMLLMAVSAFFYPFFGKKNYYCTWICPYGSIQDLAGQCADWLEGRGWWRRLQISPAWAARLGRLREALWFVLLWLMMAGLWFEWMDWEPFAAFFFTDASPIVLGIAGGFLLLSFFVRRPYCRFVCPTGTLFKVSEGNINL